MPDGCDASEATRILGVATDHVGARLTVDPASATPGRRARIHGPRGAIAVEIAPGRLTLAWDTDDRWARLHGPLLTEDLRDLLRER